MHKTLKILKFVGFSVIYILCFPILIAGSLIFYVTTLPYTLFYFSPNWGLLPKDFRPVEKYLRYFSHLHPELVFHAAEAHNRVGSSGRPPGIRYWPRHSTHSIVYFFSILNISSKWEFTPAAGLFARMESAGISRLLLWKFLRGQVEDSHLPSNNEEAEFARVMEKMNTHHLMGDNISSFAQDLNNKQRKKKQRMQEKDTVYMQQAEQKLGGFSERIKMAAPDSLDWLLIKGAIIVPSAANKYALQALVDFFPGWDKTDEKKVSEQAITWQHIYLESNWPWDD